MKYITRRQAIRTAQITTVLQIFIVLFCTVAFVEALKLGGVL